MKAKKIIIRLVLILLAIIAAIVVVLLVFSNINTKAMNNTMNAVLTKLSDYGELTKVSNDYEKIKVYGVFNFDVDQYTLEDVGNVCVMTTNMGFMQMGTIVVTPFEKDVPVLSTDFMYILTNRKYIIEMDNTVLDDGEEYQAKCAEGNALAATFDDLEPYPAEPSWLDDVQDVLARRQGSNTEGLDKMTSEMTDFYIGWLEEAGPLNEEEQVLKREATRVYSENLIAKGGISTDVFKKELGEETTRDFFNKVFFGTDR